MNMKKRIEFQKEVFGTKDLSNYLHVGYDKAKQLILTGEIPSRKIGEKYFVHKQAVINWLLKYEPQEVAK